jgi:phospholipase C
MAINEHRIAREWSRRRFIHRVAGGTGAFALAGLAGAGAGASNGQGDENEERSGKSKNKTFEFDHVILVMMENRSYDHFLGWLPEGDGRQAGLRYPDRDGTRKSTYRLAPDYQGCGHPDPGHSQADGLVEYNGGACDGWLLAGSNDIYAIGYYTEKDLSFLGPAARQFTTCDRYFASLMSETFPNRFHQHAAQTDRADNALTLSTLPTIWDRLADKGISGRYYFTDVPFLALWGLNYLPISRPFASFLSDCSRGNLPAVSFVDPGFLGEPEGVAIDDHPHADIRAGEQFLATVYAAVSKSPAWQKTILIINYDEWGGFFDHVPPPLAPQPPGDLAAGLGPRRGFRVPCVIVSPFAQRGVSSTIFDHASVLKLIESRWDLDPLTVRDAQANDLADALDFARPKRHVPRISGPGVIIPSPCAASAATLRPSVTTANEWIGLRESARAQGWPI